LKTPLVSGAELPPDRPRRGTAANFLGLKTRFGPCAFPPICSLPPTVAQPLRQRKRRYRARLWRTPHRLHRSRGAGQI